MVDVIADGADRHAEERRDLVLGQSPPGQQGNLLLATRERSSAARPTAVSSMGVWAAPHRPRRSADRTDASRWATLSPASAARRPAPASFVCRAIASITAPPISAAMTPSSSDIFDGSAPRRRAWWNAIAAALDVKPRSPSQDGHIPGIVVVGGFLRQIGAEVTFRDLRLDALRFGGNSKDVLASIDHARASPSAGGGGTLTGAYDR